MPSKSSGAASGVAIVSNNPTTLDGLQRYLAAAGVACHGSTALAEPATTGKLATMVVLFPDDYPPGGVVLFLRRLREKRPKLLILLVTREPGRFAEAARPDGRSRLPIVLPKPAFGWTILDAIRAHASEKTLP